MPSPVNQQSSNATPAAEFLREILQRIAETRGDKAKIFTFLKANLHRLNDEALLEVVPLVFEEMVADADEDTQWEVSSNFNTLGVVFNEFPLGNRGLNQELSIAAYHNALQVYIHEDFPQNWAMTQNNLGLAYKNRIRGERADNLEQAIAAYHNALQVRTREDFPEDWAQTQNNLGNAYGNRIRGERADNLALAIAAYQNALQIYTRKDFPEDWAMTQNNLGSAYSDLIRGERADNLDLAITAYHNALQIRTREAFPEFWARTQGNLVSALLEQFKLTGNVEDLDYAITSLQEAQTVISPGTDYFVNNNYTLGLALDYRYSLHNDPKDLEQAIAAYRLAAETTPWENRKLNYLVYTLAQKVKEKQPL